MAGPYVITVSDAYNAIGDRNRARAAVVYADNATDARELLEALYSGDSDALWANSTATAMAAAANMLGWGMRVIVRDNVTLAIVADCSVTNTGSDDTIDELGALMVIALNATAAIAGAAYSSNVLKVAETTDGLGDNIVEAYIYSTYSTAVPIPGFVGVITDGGASSDALTVAVCADAYTIPNVVGAFSVH